MQRIFLSDLHLDDPESRTFNGFAACLKAESKQVDEIYILGDLVEMWIGDDDDSPIAVALTKLLQSISKHCPIFLMHGNRDFLFAALRWSATHQPWMTALSYPMAMRYVLTIMHIRKCAKFCAAKLGKTKS